MALYIEMIEDKTARTVVITDSNGFKYDNTPSIVSRNLSPNMREVPSSRTISRIEKLENINLKKLREDRTWRICCSNSSTEGIKYITQMTVAGLIMLFSLCMIAFGDEKDEKMYMSMFAFTCGILLPNPKLQAKKNNFYNQPQTS